MQKVMENPKRRSALGQGLDALIPIDEPADPKGSERNISYLSIDALLPNPYQPRRLFVEETLADLSHSIKERGVIQPLIVRPAAAGGHEIVAGERRWRAAKMAGFSTIPVLIRPMSDSESLEIALVENLQREDLNPLDMAEAYDTLVKKFSYTHDVLAQRIGKDRTNITNHLRLLKLPDPIKEDLRQDRLSMGHARTLLAIDHLQTQLNLSRQVTKRKLSVRDLERIVQNYKTKQQAREKIRPPKDQAIASLETGLSRHLSTRVVIRTKHNNSGKMEIFFHSKEEFDRLLEMLGYSEDFS